MRRYEFKLVIHEGSDEFWESLDDKTGCDEVRDMMVDMLNEKGLFTDTNCELQLLAYNDNRDL